METTFYNKTGKPQIYLSTDYDNFTRGKDMQ